MRCAVCIFRIVYTKRIDAKGLKKISKIKTLIGFALYHRMPELNSVSYRTKIIKSYLEKLDRSK